MRLLRRVLWGAKTGTIFGLAFSLLALVIFLLGGQGPFEANHSSFGRIVGAYFLGGLSAGIIVGILRPLTASKVGAAMTGFVATAPVSVLMRIAIDGFQAWTVKDSILSILMCAALGAPLGVAYRDIFRDRVSG